MSSTRMNQAQPSPAGAGGGQSCLLSWQALPHRDIVGSLQATLPELLQAPQAPGSAGNAAVLEDKHEGLASSISLHCPLQCVRRVGVKIAGRILKGMLAVPRGIC